MDLSRAEIINTYVNPRPRLGIFSEEICNGLELAEILEVWYNGNTMITKENKAKAIAKVARNKADVGSPEVQVSILTDRIKEVTEHVKNNKHDFMAKRGLMQMVGKRKKLLKYLEETDFELYKKTISKLGLRK